MQEAGKWWNRFLVLIRAQLRSRAFYMVTGLMLFVFLFLNSIALPTGRQREIGAAGGGGPISGAVLEALSGDTGSYRWRVYDTRERLKTAVLRGEVDSGFVLEEKLDAAVSALEEENPAGSGEIRLPDLEAAVTVYVSPSSTKSAAAKEAVYAHILEAVTPAVLENAVRSGALFADSTEEAQKEIREKLDEVIREGSLLNVRFETRGEDSGKETMEDEAEAKARGASAVTAGTLLFLASLLFACARFREESAALAVYFREWGFLYRVLEILAPLVLAGAGLLIALFAIGRGRPAGALLLLPLLVLTAIWAALFVRLFRRESVFLFLSLALSVAAAILNSPAGALFFLRSVRYVRFVLPASWLTYALML